MMNEENALMQLGEEATERFEERLSREISAIKGIIEGPTGHLSIRVDDAKTMLGIITYAHLSQRRLFLEHVELLREADG